MRENFKRADDNGVVDIEVDLSAYGYKGKYDWLFSVFVKYNGTDETQADYEEFLETKESLIISLEHDQKAKYTGMRVVEGWSEIYFYTSTSKGFDVIVTKLLKESGYAFESNIVRDAKWNFYEVQLTPNELEHCHITSAKIIYELQEAGDDLEKIREVEHYVTFDTASQKERFVQNVAACGFEYKDDVNSDDYEHGVALVKQHGVTYDEVQKVVDELFTIIKKEHGYYEGWSTTLAHEEERTL